MNADLVLFLIQFGLGLLTGGIIAAIICSALTRRKVIRAERAAWQQAGVFHRHAQDSDL